MSWIEVQTPSRLHLGLLSWGGSTRREFGGVGLMIDAPGVRLRGARADDWSANGPLSDRVVEAGRRVAEGLERLGRVVTPIHFQIESAPAEHVGLGVGTQLGMAVAQIVAGLTGGRSLPPHELGRLAGRGRRSGIGVHGFALGGLIVDGGRRRDGPEKPPPLLARLEWPAEWYVLVVIPPGRTGLNGPSEVRAFQDLPPPLTATVDRLARLVLLDLLPNVAEANLDEFGATLEEIQKLVGQGFAPAQGGAFASQEAADLAQFLRSLGLRGVGQSSWGPTLYGFSDLPEIERQQILGEIHSQTNYSTDRCFWTSVSTSGAQLRRSDDSEE